MSMVQTASTTTRDSEVKGKMLECAPAKLSCWVERELGEAITFQRGFDLPQRLRVPGPIPIVSSSGISGYHNFAPVKAPGIVTGRYGTIGEVFYLTEDYWPLNTTLFVRDFKLLLPEYALHVLKTIDFVSHSGKSGVPGVNRNDLHQEKVLIPPLEEQTAIANALSDVDALIQELEKLIAKKQAIKTATMQQLLTGRTRLPQFTYHPDGRKNGYKPSELGEIPEDWEVVKLGQLAKFLKGYGLPKSELSESGELKCVHYGQLFTTYGPKIKRVISRTKNERTVTSLENDVLMPTSDVTPNGLATASCIVEAGVTLGGDILIIRSDKLRLNGVFFSYLVGILRDQIMQLVVGSTVFHLYGSDMAKLQFSIPVIEEQDVIATILSDMDEDIQILEKRLNKTRQIKQGMMQELLTGKTRIVNPAGAA